MQFYSPPKEERRERRKEKMKETKEEIALFTIEQIFLIQIIVF
jgi:hypothetical protein